MLRKIINEGNDNKNYKRNKYKQLTINYNSLKPSKNIVKINQKSKMNNISSNKIKTQRSSSVGSHQNSLKNTINNIPFNQNISTSMTSFQNIINYNTNSPILKNKAFSSENNINENEIIYNSNNNNNNKDLIKEENNNCINLLDKQINRVNSCINLLKNVKKDSYPCSNIKNLSASNSVDKIQLLEECISLIKQKSKNISQKEIQKKLKKKYELENKINLLNSNLSTINKNNKINLLINKKLNQQRECVIEKGKRANNENNIFNKELKELEKEIIDLKQKKLKTNNQTNLIKNEKINMENDIVFYQNEIKKLNLLNNNIIKEKEFLHNEILKSKNSIKMITQKINQIEKESNNFMNNIGILLEQTIKNE